MPLPAKARRRNPLKGTFNGNAQKQWLKAYIETGSQTKACEMTGWHYNTVKKHKNKKGRFYQKFLDAQEQILNELEAEAYRRAVDGVEEPVFYKGEECGTITRYSDQLLGLLLRANNPDKYNQSKSSVEVSGKDGGPIEVSHARSKLLDIINSTTIDVQPENRLESSQNQEEADEDPL